jgi:cytoskeletal protein RodZ
MANTKSKSESGLAHVVLLVLILVVVSVIVLVGVHVMQNQNTGETSSAPVASTKASVPATFKSNSDLDSAQASLNQTNVDSDLNPDSLNSDVDSLL